MLGQLKVVVPSKHSADGLEEHMKSLSGLRMSLGPCSLQGTHSNETVNQEIFRSLKPYLHLPDWNFLFLYTQPWMVMWLFMVIVKCLLNDSTDRSSHKKRGNNRATDEKVFFCRGRY